LKRFRSNLYTVQKIVCTEGRHIHVENKDGYLFAQAIYPTKIKAEDLPEWYVYGRYYKCFGYLSAKGVVDMKYVPSKYSNHFLKDDFLFISYSTPISEKPEASSIIDAYIGYDERIYGNEILSFLKAARKHSAYDISVIVQMIQDKADWIVQTFPEEYSDFKFDVRSLKKSQT